MTLSISVKHDYGAGAERIASLSPRLRLAMREGTVEATRIVQESVTGLVADRTGMTTAEASRIVEASLDPSVGDTSRGRVGLTDPPARIYPRTAKALSFVIDGRRITVKSVKGSRPYKLVGRGVEAAEGAVERAYREKVEEALR